MNQKGVLFIISAASGAGKTSLVSQLLNRNESNLKRVVTYTCREPREYEREGIDYHFLSRSDFEQRIERNFFLEWSQVYGTYYGCPASIRDDLNQGQSLIMIVDRAGMISLSRLIPESIRIWLTVPNLEVLRQRLLERATESLEKVEDRIAIAITENEAETSAPICNYVVVNDKFDEALYNLEQLIYDHINKQNHNSKLDQIEFL